MDNKATHYSADLKFNNTIHDTQSHFHNDFKFYMKTH